MTCSPVFLSDLGNGDRTARVTVCWHPRSKLKQQRARSRFCTVHALVPLVAGGQASDKCGHFKGLSPVICCINATMNSSPQLSFVLPLLSQQQLLSLCSDWQRSTNSPPLLPIYTLFFGLHL